MTDELPAPLTPPNCDLQDFKFMPLDVARLRDSDLASDETPEACWAAVMLWCASWHQIPAASIPDNDQWLAKHAGYAQRGKVAREWADVRDGALRGWIKCSDGRFYHPVVAEKACDAWESKLDQRWRTECGRIKKHGDRHGMSLPRPTFVEWTSMGCPSGHRLPVPEDMAGVSLGTMAVVPRETASKGEGERQGQGQKKTGAKAPSSAKVPTVAMQAVIDLYHEILPELPRALLLNADRKRLLTKVWTWVFTSKRADGTHRATSHAEAVAWFTEYFQRARDNDFLMGRLAKGDGHENWQCDLDFLLTDKGMKHVIEKTTERKAA